jgi:hypothetical protein
LILISAVVAVSAQLLSKDLKSGLGWLTDDFESVVFVLDQGAVV